MIDSRPLWQRALENRQRQRLGHRWTAEEALAAGLKGAEKTRKSDKPIPYQLTGKR